MLEADWELPVMVTAGLTTVLWGNRAEHLEQAVIGWYTAPTLGDWW